MSDEQGTAGKARRNILLALGLLAVLAGAASGFWYVFARGVVSTDDARIDADLLDIAPSVSGTLSTVPVQEGDHVGMGQVLFTLDTEVLQAAMDGALADRASAQATQAIAQAAYDKALRGPRAEEIHMQQAVVAKLAAQAREAKANGQRARALYQRHVLSSAEEEQTQTASDAARYALEEGQTKLALLRSGTREEDLAAAQAQLDLARNRLAASDAALRRMRADLTAAESRAPFDGVVVRRWKHPGAVLAAGTPVLTLLNPATLYVSANIEEGDLARVSTGDRVAITLDAYPGATLEGRVQRILRATNSQFSIIPAEGVSGAYIKVAQRVPLRIGLLAPPTLPLAPGLSVEVRIFTGSAAAGRTAANE